MSSIASWAAALFSSPTVNIQNANPSQNDNTTCTHDASVQTLLSASGNSNVSKENELLLRKQREDIVDFDVLYLSDEASDSDRNSPITKKKRRTRIPDKPNKSMSFWTILKDFIGQNLSTVPLPVNFNEPLTLLQRITETFEYSYLLDKAADCENVYDQIAYLAAFSISGYATSAVRNGKPFNPLLNETFECDRTEDLGWKCIAEQVSHRPPISSVHCESGKWICWKEISGDLFFRGKYIRVIPTDRIYVKFKTNKNTYRFGRAETTVNNIIFGKLWLDHNGEVNIIGLDSGAKCTLTYVPYSSFSRGAQRKVEGVIVDESNKTQRIIRGNWDNKVEVAFNVNADSGKVSADKVTFETVWESRLPSPESKKYYNLSEFACGLNEYEADVAPTDSRKRPDLRLMEEGKWDESNEMKLKLEEKQRKVRYQREAECAALGVAKSTGIGQSPPTWFVKTRDALNVNGESFIYIYTGGYWEAKETGIWSECPDIFL